MNSVICKNSMGRFENKKCRYKKKLSKINLEAGSFKKGENKELGL